MAGGGAGGGAEQAARQVPHLQHQQPQLHQRQRAAAAGLHVQVAGKLTRELTRAN